MSDTEQPSRPPIGHWRDWLGDFTPAPPPVDESNTEPEVVPVVPPRRGRRGVLVAAALMLVAAVGGSGFFLLSQRTPAPEVSTAADTTTSESVSETPVSETVGDDAAVDQWCADLGGVRDGGDPSTAAGTLVALEHAYYVDRDADAVAGFYVPTSALDHGTLAASIEAVPESSHHCVVVSPIDGDLYALDAYVLDADGTQREYRLKAALENTDAGWRVAEMSVRKDAS